MSVSKSRKWDDSGIVSALLGIALAVSVAVNIGQVVASRTAPNMDVGNESTRGQYATRNLNLAVVNGNCCVIETTSRIGSNQYGLMQVWTSGRVRLYEQDQLIFERQLRVSDNGSEELNKQ